MRVDLFDFELPPERIALRPAEPRHDARMLVVPAPDTSAGKESFLDAGVLDLPGFLRAGDVLVVNDTRVIPAQIKGVRNREGAEARVTCTLHKREAENVWRVFAKPGKRLRAGDAIRFGDAGENYSCEMGHLDATVVEKATDGSVLLEFSLFGSFLDEAIERLGEMPLPPYISGRRSIDRRDDMDYQTLFAAKPGAVAAPTAGLHFTPELMDRLEQAGVKTCRVTLHVGGGTFLPVKSEDTASHVMHSEFGEIDSATAAQLNTARKNGGRIIAVGTTSLRILESATTEEGVIQPIALDTDIFITPSYVFRAVDVLLTNFHLPRSTLFMLVSAFCGLDTMQAAYQHAIKNQYRFYSYGDACLLFRNDGNSHKPKPV